MADIMVGIDSVQGDSVHEGYTDQIRCSQMNHAITLATDPTITARVDGSSTHGPMALVHGIDKASPKLRLAALKGQNLGTVKVTVLKMVDGASQPTEVFELTDVYVTSVASGVKGDAPNNADDDPLEVFALSYSSISATANVYADGSKTGSVSGGWNVANSTELT